MLKTEDFIMGWGADNLTGQPPSGMEYDPDGAGWHYPKRQLAEPLKTYTALEKAELNKYMRQQKARSNTKALGKAVIIWGPWLFIALCFATKGCAQSVASHREASIAGRKLPALNLPVKKAINLGINNHFCL